MPPRVHIMHFCHTCVLCYIIIMSMLRVVRFVALSIVEFLYVCHNFSVGPFIDGTIVYVWNWWWRNYYEMRRGYPLPILRSLMSIWFRNQVLWCNILVLINHWQLVCILGYCCERSDHYVRLSNIWLLGSPYIYFCTHYAEWWFLLMKSWSTNS